MSRGVSVYYLLDPRNGTTPQVGERAYVGYTRNLRLRRKAHFSRRNLARQSIATCWMRSLFDIGVKPIISVRCVTEDATEAKRIEVALISSLRAKGVALTNGTDGGDGGSGRIKTDEEKRKIGAAASLRRHSDETKLQISEAKRGVKLSEEHRAKISEAGLGRKPSKETREKQSIAKRGRKMSDVTRMKLSELNRGKRHSDGARANM